MALHRFDSPAFEAFNLSKTTYSEVLLEQERVGGDSVLNRILNYGRLGGFGAGRTLSPDDYRIPGFGEGSDLSGFISYIFSISKEEIQREWSPGSYGSSSTSFNDHFVRHGDEVGARSPETYLEKAISFKNRAARGRGRVVSGATEGVQRYTQGDTYIDVAPDGRIISFGSTHENDYNTSDNYDEYNDDWGW